MQNVNVTMINSNQIVYSIEVMPEKDMMYVNLPKY